MDMNRLLINIAIQYSGIQGLKSHNSVSVVQFTGSRTKIRAIILRFTCEVAPKYMCAKLILK